MYCPGCGRQLEQMNISGILVDVCKGGCGGIWFDQHELQKVGAQSETAGEALFDVERDPDVKVDPSAKRKCPKCAGQYMLRHFESIKREVEIDECPACGGVWLDHGELGRIRKQFATDEEKRQATQAFLSELYAEKFGDALAETEAKLRKVTKIARVFRFICPTYYIPGKQEWGAF